MDSIVRFGLREGAASARDRIGGGPGNQGNGKKPERLPHGEERILRVSNHEPEHAAILRDGAEPVIGRAFARPVGASSG
jgi:hypothetical protein